MAEKNIIIEKALNKNYLNVQEKEIEVDDISVKLGKDFKKNTAKLGRNLKDSFIRFVGDEAFLFNAHIGRLTTTHHFYGHEERGSRKLLLHRKQLDKMLKAVTRDGYTIVPLQLYFNARNIVKLQIAIAKGKQLHDKRNDLKEKDQKRDIARSMKDY